MCPQRQLTLSEAWLNGQALTASEIAQLLGVSRQAISQRLHRAGIEPSIIDAAPRYTYADAHEAVGEMVRGRS